jgi:hypothetical protein
VKALRKKQQLAERLIGACLPCWRILALQRGDNLREQSCLPVGRHLVRPQVTRLNPICGKHPSDFAHREGIGVIPAAGLLGDQSVPLQIREQWLTDLCPLTKICPP